MWRHLVRPLSALRVVRGRPLVTCGAPLAPAVSGPAAVTRRSVYTSTPSSGIVPLSSLPEKVGFDLKPPANKTTTSDRAPPYNQKLVWRGTPKNVLIVKKINTHSTTKALNNAASYLSKLGMRVLVEPQVLVEHPHLQAFDPDEKNLLSDYIDLLITLGGDGTILHVSSLFQREIPPVIAFSMGTVGFMTPFDVKTLEKEVDKVLASGSSCAVRTRLMAQFCDGLTRLPVVETQFLNELAVHRGNSLRITHVDMYVDDLLVTRVQGDGVIVSTPTGSTAYSLSAGGCMVHPAIHAILVTPICPRSLSFRPTIFPSDSVVKLKIVANSSALAAIDGQWCHHLQGDDFVVVRDSPYPLFSINRTDETTDWVSDINERLHFNQLPTPRFMTFT